MQKSTVSAQPELIEAYRETNYDALIPQNLLFDEVKQRRETGYDVDLIVEEANDCDPNDREAVLALVDRLATSTRTAEWAYVEPDTLPEILATLGVLPEPTPVDAETLRDKISAAWSGRIAGCNLGKPVEMGSHWTVEHIREYLELGDAYPLRDYFPILDPMPERFELRDNWPFTTRGNVNGSARDDDIDYPILALHLLELHGRTLQPEHVGEAWLMLFPLTQVYTAERAAYINLATGVPQRDVATVRNPYREWIGALIRGDVFGYVLPGDPLAAATLAFRDASLSHVGNGIYGEMWAAALVSAAFVSSSAHEAIVSSLAVVPPRSRLAEAIRHVLSLHEKGLSWEEALEEIRAAYGHYAWVHTINNAAVIVAGLLWGEGDYTTAVGRTVMSGWDTDSNGATVGSVAAILAGTANLPANLIAPLHDTTRSALFGYDDSKISDLADRTYRLATEGLK